MAANQNQSGWNRSSGAAKPIPKKPGALRGIVGCLAIIALVIIGVWYFIFNDNAVEVHQGEKRTVLKRPSLNGHGIKSAETARVDKVRPPVTQVKKTDWRKVAIVDFTNEERRAILLNAQDPDDPSEYGATEQLLGMLFSLPLGMDPPPIPFCFGEDAGLDDFEAGLKNKIVVIDKDDDAKAERKLAIAQAKLEMLELVTKGETPQTILEDAYKMRKEAALLRNGMVEDMMLWVEQDTPGDVAIDVAIQQFNQRLEKQGILKITREDLGLEDNKGESEQ